VKELNNRYRVIETTKTHIDQFNKKIQKSGETTEDFASELKGLYDKAYPTRYKDTRTIDSLNWLFEGLLDQKVSFKVQFDKDPHDEAVSQTINFIETKRQLRSDKEKHIRQVRQMSTEETDETSDNSDDDTAERRNLLDK